MDPSTPICRVGLIGCGIAAQFFHAPAYRRLAGTARVIAIADPNSANRQLVQEILGYGVQQYASPEDMLRHEDLDLVDVMLPHHLYVDVVPRIVARCRSMLLEKPFARTLDEAKIILEATSSVPFSVVHNYLYGRRYKQALEAIRVGDIGQPFLVRLENLQTGMTSIDPDLSTDWRTNSRQSGPGTFHNHGYHLVYLARALMGSEVESVSAIMGNYFEKGDTLDTAIVTLRHASGGLSVLVDGRLQKQNSQEVEEVLGTDGTLRLSFDPHSLDEFRSALSRVPRVEALKQSPFARSTADCISDFIGAVQDGRRPPISGEEAYRTLQITLAAYESHEKRMVVRTPV